MEWVGIASSGRVTRVGPAWTTGRDGLHRRRACDEQVASRWIVASNPHDAVATIKPYIDAGLNHLVFHGPGHDQERFLSQFTEDVVPELRKLG